PSPAERLFPRNRIVGAVSELPWDGPGGVPDWLVSTAEGPGATAELSTGGVRASCLRPSPDPSSRPQAPSRTAARMRMYSLLIFTVLPFKTANPNTGARNLFRATVSDTKVQDDRPRTHRASTHEGLPKRIALVERPA